MGIKRISLILAAVCLVIFYSLALYFMLIGKGKIAFFMCVIGMALAVISIFVFLISSIKNK